MAVLSWWNDLSGFQNIALFDSHFEEHFYDEPTTVRVDTTGPLMFVQSKIRNQRIRINNKGLLPSTYFPISLSRPPLVYLYPNPSCLYSLSKEKVPEKEKGSIGSGSKVAEACRVLARASLCFSNVRRLVIHDLHLLFLVIDIA